jgi:hypothetical protein
MDAETVRALSAPAGRRLLSQAEAASDPQCLPQVDPLATAESLRRDHPAALVAAAMTVVSLRRRAVAKLGADARVLLLDRAGLEQSTRASVAAYRAARLAEADLGDGRRVQTVVDLGCGIGTDLVAMARASLRVTGVDRDPARVAMARANLAALGLAGQVVEADVGSINRDGFDAAFADPARRDGSGRRFDPAAHSPPWSYVERLLTEGPAVAVVKTAPGIPHARVPAGVEAQWVSDGGDLVEACLWGRGLAQTSRRATLLPSGATCTEDDLPPAPVGSGAMGQWLHEPDDAVIRAGLVQVVAARVGGWLLDPHLAYVTTDSPDRTPLARCHRVLEEVPYREKPLRQALRSRGVGALTIKKRGVDVLPEQLRRRLAAGGALDGHAAATLVLTRVQGRGRAFLVEPGD